MNYVKSKYGSLKLENPPAIDYVNYWGKDGRSTIQEQVYNINGVKFNGFTKAGAIIQHFIGDSMLEIGAAPGELLRVSRDLGYDCEGIAPETDPYIALHSRCTIHQCTFEEFESDKQFDNVVAMDVLEHIEDGRAFVNKALTFCKGRLIFMLPVLEFMQNPEVMMCDEHIWLYSKKHLRAFGFTEFVPWIDGHTICIHNG